MFRKTFCLINEENLRQNIKNIKDNYRDYTYYIAVIKGNAYGHGMQIVNSLIEGGANYIAVATLEEALKVRSFNKEIPLLCLEPISSGSLKVAFENKVALTISNEYNLNDAIKSGLAFNIHLKVDSGMNRLGFKKKEVLQNAVKSISSSENLALEGIYTHLATSGVNDIWYDKQIENFKEITSQIDLNAIPIVHIDRSITLVHHKKPDFVNGVRMGICMYGFAQSLNIPTGISAIKRSLRLMGKNMSQPIFSNSLQLKTAMSLYSEVIEVKQVKKGEFVGYGATFKVQKDMTVATLAIGYYDGMSKRFKEVYLNGARRQILGELCMDMTFVEADDNTKIGDTAEIFGDKISIRRVCAKSGLSAYRLLTRITSRVPRVMNGKEYEL